MCSHSALPRTLRHVDQRDSVIVRRTCGLREPLLPERARAAAPPEPERVAAAGGIGRACAQALGAFDIYLSGLLSILQKAKHTNGRVRGPTPEASHVGRPAYMSGQCRAACQMNAT